MPPEQTLPNSSPEIRGLTLSDLFAGIAGAGAALALPPIFSFSSAVQVPQTTLVVTFLIGVLLSVALAMAAVDLMRQSDHRRAARPAEWIAITLTVQMLKMTLPSVVTVVNSGQLPESMTFGTARWLLAGAALAATVALVFALGALGKNAPPVVKTVWLAAVALLLAWGPVEVLAGQLPAILVGKLASGDSDWPSWLVREGCEYLALIPWGLLVGIPVVATVLDLGGRPPKSWSWAEWVGIIAAGGLATVLLMHLYVLRDEWPSTGLNATRVVVPIWIVVVGLLSRLIVLRTRNVWSRLMGANQHDARPA